ncbi:MAG: hypothetical protein M1480_07720 [Bacteroidetes bacterium]|nr:hypothetical protein [Bacteroidota bacterium]
MTISKKILANKLSDYLNNKIKKDELVDWCEHAMMEDIFESENVQQIVASIGLMDTNNFEVTYEDLTSMLNQLGFKLKVEVL